LNSDYFSEKMKRWDTYFHSVCEAVSSKSPCLSRQIGAILVRDNSILASGYNGPARGYHHCKDQCPRKALGFESGKGLEHCPAVHAEVNSVANAARIGAMTVGAKLYMNCIIPCKDCMALLINAGISEIIVDEVTPYHELSLDMAAKCNIKIRSFVL